MISKVGYDIDVGDEDDPYVAAVDAALEGPVQGLVPGTFLVDFLPFLRYVPTWFPGATSQRLWAKWQAAAETLKNLPYDHVKAALDQVRLSSSPFLCHGVSTNQRFCTRGRGGVVRR